MTREDEERCHQICRGRQYETGEGTCSPICLDSLGSPRDKPGGCPHAPRVFARLVRAERDGRSELIDRREALA